MNISPHIRLKISSERAEAAEIDEITDHLACAPSEIIESPVTILQCDGSGRKEDRVYYFWVLNSPIGEDQGGFARVMGLIDVIRPFSDRLVSLDQRFGRTLDIICSITWQNLPHRIPNFDWFQLPADAVKILGEWKVGISYETFWFHNPDSKPARRSWWQKFHRANR